MCNFDVKKNIASLILNQIHRQSNNNKSDQCFIFNWSQSILCSDDGCLYTLSGVSGALCRGSYMLLGVSGALCRGWCTLLGVSGTRCRVRVVHCVGGGARCRVRVVHCVGGGALCRGCGSDRGVGRRPPPDARPLQRVDGPQAAERAALQADAATRLPLREQTALLQETRRATERRQGDLRFQKLIGGAR